MADAVNTRSRFTKAIPIDHIRSILEYQPEDGLLRWKERPGHNNFNSKFMGKVAGRIVRRKDGGCHIGITFQSQFFYAHRIIWVLAHGPIPDGMEIDHIDGDGTNNRLENLRLVSSSQNKKNMRKRSDNKSGHAGVWLHPRGKFYAYGKVEGKRVSIGFYDTFEAAVEVRKAWQDANGFSKRHGVEGCRKIDFPNRPAPNQTPKVKKEYLGGFWRMGMRIADQLKLLGLDPTKEFKFTISSDECGITLRVDAQSDE